MEDKRKVLLVDNSSDRKDRIRALKEKGFVVYPALRIAEARTRFRPGSYDLIVIDSGEDQSGAIELCDSVREKSPKQNLLLMVAKGSPVPARDYVVSREPRELAQKVEDILKRRPTELGLVA